MMDAEQHTPSLKGSILKTSMIKFRIDITHLQTFVAFGERAGTLLVQKVQ